MKISYSWLKEYLSIDASPEELGKILTSIGLEVEGIETYESVKGGLEGFVVGEVKTKIKHPSADKLSLTTVDVGKEKLLSIVCGASNVEAGQKVIVATIGTTIYKGEESFQIKQAKIRGELSEGMICAEDEIGIGTSHEGIMVLPAETKIGTLAKDYFGVYKDTIIEVAITPNHIDAASHFGVARDLFAFFKNQGKNISLRKPSVDNFKIDKTENFIFVEVENIEACPRYAGLTISNIKVAESPNWLKNKLKAIGQKPINNIVDVTNFVLHELGQPLHAFDADKINGNKVIIKTLNEGTQFVTLDGVERKLFAEDLMICDSLGGMCIGGVFGGKDSGVSENTTNIFLESAYFNPTFIRKTSKKHGLNTDASFRFERGVDPNVQIFALKRTALLIQQVAGGEISSEITDIYPKPIQDFEIKISFDYIDSLIGKKIEKNVIKNILTSLEIKIVAENDFELTLKVPPYRVDVQKPADIVEEILRIYGYNNVEIPLHLNAAISYQAKPDTHKIRNLISNFLSSNGFNEMMANSLQKSAYYDYSQTFPADSCVKIANPLSSDLNVLRQTLLFGGLEAISHNLNHKNPNLKLYEFGNCYSKKTGNGLNSYQEEQHLSLFLTGFRNEENWVEKQKPTSFYLLKTFVENILKNLNFDAEKWQISETQKDIFQYGLTFSLQNEIFVQFGLVNPQFSKLKFFDIEQEIFFADFYWDNVLKHFSEKIEYVEIAKYPEVRRDLALLVDNEVRFEQIKTLAESVEKSLLKKVSIFDIYQDEKLGENKKSYAISFVLQDENRTLTDSQIDGIMKKMISTFEKQLSAKIR